MMKKITLRFEDRVLEKKYQESLKESNILPVKKLLFFNIFFHLTLTILSLKNENYTITVFTLCNLPIFITLFWIYCKTKHFKILWRNFYLIFSIIIPFAVLSWLLMFDREKNNIIVGSEDFFILGFCFKMYISHVYLFKMSWLYVIIIKFSVSIYILSLDLMVHGRLHDPGIILLCLTCSSFLFDYQKEKNDRHVFYTEYLLDEHFQNIKHILEEMPDEVIIWNKNGLVFANKSSYELFQGSNLNNLQKTIIANVEIQESEVGILNDENHGIRQCLSFSGKIQSYLNMKTDLNFQNLIAHIRINDPLQNNDCITKEFDIRMKKIYWEKDFAILLILSQVSEKNLKSRLEFVNSFLTFVLGHISHEMNTPIHIIVGIIQHIKNKIKDFSLLEDLKIIQSTSEILMTMVKIMIDLFEIRKGTLCLNINKIDVEMEINDVLNLFKEILSRKKIVVLINTEIKLLNTDVHRFKQILIFLLNKATEKMSSGTLKINIISDDSTNLCYEVRLDSSGEFETIEDNSDSNSLINICSSPFLNSKPNETKSQREFSLIDYLILCLSCGKSECLEISNCKPIDKYSTVSNIKYFFRISDVHHYDTIKLKDPFKEKNNFKIKFLYSEKVSPTFGDFDYNFQSMNEDVTSSKSIVYNMNQNTINSLKYNVLNADDIFFSLMVISNYCRIRSLPVTEAKNGLDAFEKVQNLYNVDKKIFDLIFMDCDMPVMNGFESAKNITDFYQKKKVKNYTILAITANATNQDVIQDCHKSGIKEIIEKPLTIQKFGEILKNYLNI